MKYAVITGGTKGIGKAIGLKLLEENYSVILNYTNDDVNALKVFNEFSHQFEGRIHLLKMDLSHPANIDDFCNKILQITEHVDILVFNAGKTNRMPLNEIKIDDWNSVLNTNLTLPLFITQRLLPNFRENAVIIFTGSILGIHPHSLSISYGVSKAATHSLMQNLVKFLSPQKIRVNAIAPGFIDTDWQTSKPKEIRDRITEKIANKRFGKPEEVASACLFLINNEYMNGEILVIDGGYCYQ